LRKVGATPVEPPPLDAWRELLVLMSQLCYESDQDRDTLERSIEISSRDMQRLYQDLKRRPRASAPSRMRSCARRWSRRSKGSCWSTTTARVIAVNKRFGDVALPDAVDGVARISGRWPRRR